MDRTQLAASVLRQAAQQRRRLANETVADLLREADELDAAADEFDAGVAIEPAEQDQPDASVEWGDDGVTYALPEAVSDPEALAQALATLRPARAAARKPRRAERVAPDQMPRMQ